MPLATKDAWLKGPSDLREATVSDVPGPGEEVRVRGLPAAFANEAQSEALEMVQKGREQISRVNVAKMEAIQFAHGVIEPVFTLEEATLISERFGPAFRKVIDKIDELSGVNKDAIEAAEARFPSGGAEEGGADVGNGATPGDGGSSVPARTGA